MRSLIFGPKNFFQSVHHDPFFTPTIAAATATGLSTGAALAPAIPIAAGSAITSLAVPGALALPSLTTVGTVLSGVQAVTNVVSKITEGKQASAEADAISAQARRSEYQQINRDSKTLAQQRNVGAASGLVTTSDTPLSVFADSVRELEMNAANVRRGGEIQASQRRAEATQAYQGIPGAAINPLLTNKSLLSQMMGRA